MGSVMCYIKTEYGVHATKRIPQVTVTSIEKLVSEYITK